MGDSCPLIWLCTKSIQKKNILFIRFISFTYIEIVNVIFQCAIKRQHLLSKWLKRQFMSIIHFIYNRFCFHVTSLPQLHDTYKMWQKGTTSTLCNQSLKPQIHHSYLSSYLVSIYLYSGSSGKCSVFSRKIHLKSSVVGFDTELVTQLYLLLTVDPYCHMHQFNFKV